MTLKKILSAVLIVTLFSLTSSGCKKEEIISGAVAAGTVLGGLGTFLGAFTGGNSVSVDIPKISTEDKTTDKEKVPEKIESVATNPEPETESAAPSSKISQLENLSNNADVENIQPEKKIAEIKTAEVKAVEDTAKNTPADKILQQVFDYDEQAVQETKDIQYEKVESKDFGGYSFDGVAEFQSAGILGDNANGMVTNSSRKGTQPHYEFEDGSRLDIVAKYYNGNIESLRSDIKRNHSEFTGTNPREIKDFQVTPVDENTVIKTWIDTQRKQDVIQKTFAVEDRYNKCAIRNVTFRYNIHDVTDRTKAVAKHIFDSFKPGLDD